MPPRLPVKPRLPGHSLKVFYQIRVTALLTYVRTIATNIRGFWDLGELADGIESRLAASSRGTPKSLRLEIRTESQRNSQQ
jgi:hypothetical protein